ncbi:hypothetical protein [Pseudomonas monteilii]|uniref:hypothetical protein n=1 Tax=Pseudomonas monteilii TaxID=76759 RepID=UPI0018AB2023|nr:hypothetical protein [Pseudomonas monteilii]MBF8745350.1 hypothetical protein [Pseudomonas monteilii]
MPAELDALLRRPLAWGAPVPTLLAALRKWISDTNPSCLLHPHGFHVLLLKRSEGEEWRLHLWPPTARQSTGMPARIHTHDRHVESRILKGSLLNMDYRSVVTNEHGHPLYSVTYAGDRYVGNTSNILQNTGERIALTETGRRQLGIGDHYRLERHTYHEAIAPEHQATITLVCMHSRDPGAIMVVGLDGYPEVVAFERTKNKASIFLKDL